MLFSIVVRSPLKKIGGPQKKILRPPVVSHEKKQNNNLISCNQKERAETFSKIKNYFQIIIDRHFSPELLNRVNS